MVAGFDVIDFLHVLTRLQRGRRLLELFQLQSDRGPPGAGWRQVRLDGLAMPASPVTFPHGISFTLIMCDGGAR
jgi:hypothetical protein